MDVVLFFMLNFKAGGRSMKRTAILFFVVVVLCTGAVFTEVYAVSEKTVTAVVINMTDEYLELKRGRQEITVYFDQSTKYLNRSGAEASWDILDICHLVRATYIVRDNKKILVRVRLIRQGRCIQ